MAGQISQAHALNAPSTSAVNSSLDYINGHGSLPDAPSSVNTVNNSTPAAPPAATPATKKAAKGKKAADPNETGKLLAAKINQLELDAVEEKDQEFEIEREVKKATRDLTNLLGGMDNANARVDAVQKKYAELLASQKRLEKENAKNKKRADLIQKEKDSVRSDFTKTNSVKDKLEKLSRELQRENKKLKDDQRRIEDSEKASREELSDRTDHCFREIEKMYAKQDSPESNKQGVELDELFRSKFKSYVDQYELREHHFYALLRTKEAENQLNLARMEDYRKRSESEMVKSRTLSTQVSTFSQTETELRNQLNIYVEKFKQVEDTLNNSNDLFLTFRKEMEEMSKKTKRLEKENLNFTRKHESTNHNIAKMAEERTKVLKEMEQLRKKNTTLESVIRRMQAQGRGSASEGPLEGDGEDTQSDYDEEYDDEEDESEGEPYDDDDTEDDAPQAQPGDARVYGPVPPPPPAVQPQVNGNAAHGGRVNGQVNGVNSSVVI